jgi:outer membrane protein assembly factor BamE (lipoprotein component of BamABCDE complex)
MHATTRFPWPAVLLLAGCASTGAETRPRAPEAAERSFTLGLVQKEIRVGMSETEVAGALGSPNIVTRDSSGHEAWVYDKIATEASYSTSRTAALASGSAVPGASLLLGVVGGSRSEGRSSTSQKTLTVIIRFDGSGLVEAFSFHASRF